MSLSNETTLNLNTQAQSNKTKERIVLNAVPAIASAIFRSSKINLDAHKGAVVSLAMVNAFVELQLDALYITDDIVTHCEYHLGKARKLNQTLTEVKGSGKNILIVAEALGLVTIVEQEFKLTEKWASMVLTKEVALPCVGKIDDNERLTSYVKGGKVKPSKLLKESIQFLQDTEYSVHGDMLNILTELQASIKILPESQTRNYMMSELETYRYVIDGCKMVSNEEVLTSEYDADNRGRLYHVACAGANPQASDLARSLYAHNISNEVDKHEHLDGYDQAPTGYTEAYSMFMAELEDTAGNSKYTTPEALTYIANNPVRYLEVVLSKMSNINPDIRLDVPKKPFTLVRLALDWLDFETKGYCDSRLGFGLDAKCSGTQYFAIIAGCHTMCEATGITTKAQSDTIDPYVMSAEQLSLEKGYAFANRSFIKTPYMAVQYGGGKNALLTSRDNVQNLKDAGVSPTEMDNVAGDCIDAINHALGAKINNLKAVVQDTLTDMLEASGKAYLPYRHSDGQLVFKPAAPSIDVCESFSIYLGGSKRIYFGKDGENWTVQSSTPTADEYVRTFMVNYIQGIDALVARTVAKYAKRAGLKAYTSIHDCFRTTLADAPKLKAVIADAYNEVFVETDQHEHLMKIIGRPNMPSYTNVVTREILDHNNSFYFCV